MRFGGHGPPQCRPHTALELDPNPHRGSGTKVHVPRRYTELALEQVTRDANFLMEQGLMDYSLLLGIHNRRLGLAQEDPQNPTSTPSSIGGVAASHNAVGNRGTADETAPGLQLAGEENLYYLGIIDTLQRWNLQKWLEKARQTLIP